jgi:hypothetical protein
MISATRTDKIGKEELVAVVHDLAEYQFATGRLSRRVLPNADRNTTSFQDRKMDVGQNVEERGCEIFSRVAQDASQHSPAHI